MYLEHFGLNEAPFRITPHTDFFFAGANRGATLDALVYAITHDEGIVKVSGEVGSGKTMLCRVLMERLPERVTTIYLANPSLSRDDILYAIADELTLVVPENARTATVLRALHTHLIQSFSDGKQVVVLIDEAHAMPMETLEEIRLLSNLESNKHKLLQLVLFGQPELNDVLSRPDMRQLKERITHNFVLEPLIHDDVAGYIEFRMRAAGYKGPNLFVPDAIKLIAKASLGLTRRINIIADKALLAAFSSGGHQIGQAEVTAAIKDCDFSTTSFTKPRSQLPLVLALIIVTTLFIGFILGGHFNSLVGGSEQTNSRLSNVAPTRAEAPPVTQPAAVAEGKPTSIAPAISVPSDTTTGPSNLKDDSPANGPLSGERANVSEQKKSDGAVTTSAPVAPAVQNKASAKPTEIKLGELTQERVEAGRTWLQTANDNHWFIQLLATDETRADAIESYLKKVRKAGDIDDLRAYLSDLPGGTRIGIIFGDFESREAAYAALRGLPKPLLAGKPYPRQVIRLR